MTYHTNVYSTDVGATNITPSDEMKEEGIAREVVMKYKNVSC